MKIRAATFNIRNSSAPDGDNAWPVRRNATVAAIEELDADVVGLQEVLPDQLEYLRWRFPRHEIAGVGRDDGMSAGEHSVVLVRPGDWRMEKHETRWLSDDPDRPGSVGWDADLTRIATLVWLRHVNGTTIGVANTHYDHAGLMAQLESSRLLARWTSGELPWIVMGDLNATPDSPPLKALIEAGLRYAVPAEAGGSWHDFTGATDDERIDHILVTKSWKVLEATVSHFRPGGRLPSDHWPVVATLELG
ncbi:endonuclease/exonuclease/phosphatase family metal-dependent hydrolase [Kribbella antiqua]|uniref:Endonuclease/exonuclease/phosphatase family metal-dependent hydrolase n=1 Tax=Kribbella antiqua TaxID=2512217 RepID=A0A4R2IWH4_9ACTN|nr:endonuclease/exonuclease/phosphatase family protein [Kribbella antiqua]TCO49242.1 endonuclease/exonuclease/phosphatase family metal-dependent hydrolase [Kribbella antiqua]